MSIDPGDLWATLSPAQRRQIVDEMAAILAEVSREVRTGDADLMHPLISLPGLPRNKRIKLSVVLSEKNPGIAAGVIIFRRHESIAGIRRTMRLSTCNTMRGAIDDTRPDPWLSAGEPFPQ
jgi:hypothetical protein